MIGNQAHIGKAEETTRLDTVVISATKTDLSKKQVTQTVNTIENKEIAQQQVTEISEIMKNIPGVSIPQTGSRGSSTSIFIRGGSSNHNLVLVDGVRVNAAGGGFDFSQFPLDNIDRIELLKGPQGSLYGSDAMSAVINIITKKGKGPVVTDITAAGGNNNTFEEKINVSGGAGNGGFSVGASRVDTDGVLNVNNRFNQNSFSTRLDQKLYDKINLNASVRYLDGLYQIPTASAGDRFDILDPQNFTRRRKTILSSGVDSSLTSWWDHKLQLGLLNEERFSTDPRNPVVDTADSQSHSAEGRQSIDYSWNFKLPVVMEVNTIFTAGIAMERELFEQTSRRITTSTTSTAIDQSRMNHAYFFQGQWNWKDMVFLTPGVRMEQNEVYGTEANPRVTGGFMIPPTQTKLRASYAQGITEPTFTQSFGGATTLPSPNLRPERIKSWETGFDQYLMDDKVEINFTYFHNEYKDLISFINTTLPFRNILKAESSGIETVIKVSQKVQSYDLSLYLSHTYLETKALEDGTVGGTLFTPGQELLRRPKHRGAITLNIEHSRFNFNWNTTMQGESIDRDFSTVPERRVNLQPYAKTDIAGSVVVWKGAPEVRVFAKVENLFNVKYEEVLGFSAPRLQALAGVGVKFQ